MMRAMVVAAVMLLAGAGAASAQQYGIWKYETTKNDWDDTRTLMVSGDARDQNRKELQVSFWCYGDEPVFAIQWVGYLHGDSDGDIRVQYRVDSRPAEMDLWAPLWKNSMVLVTPDAPYFSHARQRALFDAMKQGTSLMLAVVDPADNEERKATFSLAGFSRAVQLLPCWR
jgi:hypothetical protein